MFIGLSISFFRYIDIIDTLNDVSMTPLLPALMSANIIITKSLVQSNSLVQTLILVFLNRHFHSSECCLASVIVDTRIARSKHVISTHLMSWVRKIVSQAVSLLHQRNCMHQSFEIRIMIKI